LKGSLERLKEIKLCSNADLKNARELAESIMSPPASKRVADIERMFKALGGHNRIVILLMLSRKEMCVCEMTAALNIPQPSISHELGILEREEFIKRRRVGRWVFYSLSKNFLTDNLINPLFREISEMST
jgi:DNA-binding transcriptional ArsR family regulator